MKVESIKQHRILLFILIIRVELVLKKIIK